MIANHRQAVQGSVSRPFWVRAGVRVRVRRWVYTRILFHQEVLPSSQARKVYRPKDPCDQIVRRADNSSTGRRTQPALYSSSRRYSTVLLLALPAETLSLPDLANPPLLVSLRTLFCTYYLLRFVFYFL